MFYMIEVRDSDGNDCDVFDAIVEAPNKDAALDQLWKHLDEAYPGDESDGGEGTFHPCDCSCEHHKSEVCEECQDGWECSHGGLLVDSENIEEHDTRKAAMAARAVSLAKLVRVGGRHHGYAYHSLIDLTP